jgi:hypothetical protein
VVSDWVSSRDREAHQRSLMNLDKIVIVEESASIFQSRPIKSAQETLATGQLSKLVIAAPQIVNSDAAGSFIVNVPNNAGGYTPIRIQKFGNGYVGPQGEFYYPFPQVTQLKAMYGL